MTDRFTLADLNSKRHFILEGEPLTTLDPTCSFCHKPGSQVDFLLLGSYAAVCSECIKLHNRIYDEYIAQETKGETDAVEVHGD